MKCSVFSAGHAHSDEPDAFRFQLRRPAFGIAEERIAAIDQDVAFLQMRQQVRDNVVNGFTCRDKEHDSARLLEHIHQIRWRVDPPQCLRACVERPDFFLVQVVADHGVAVARYVQRQAASHGAKANHAETVFFSHLALLDFPYWQIWGEPLARRRANGPTYKASLTALRFLDCARLIPAFRARGRGRPLSAT